MRPHHCGLLAGNAQLGVTLEVYILAAARYACEAGGLPWGTSWFTLDTGKNPN